MISFEDLRDSYMRSMVLENRSPHTVKGVKSPLNVFFRYLRSEGINDLKKVTSKIIENYRRFIYKQKKQDGTPYASQTIILWLVAVFQFFQYLKKKGYVLVDPAFGLELPKNEIKIPRDVMNMEEVKLILSIPDIREPLGYRDRTIMEVLYSTGVRNSELCDIKLIDVNLAKKEIIVVKGKGGKTRIVPLNDVAIRFITGYLERIRPYLIKDDREEYLFINQHGTKLESGTLMDIIRMYRKLAGLKKKITPHSFRHTMATQLLDGGMNVRYIQAILGHTSLKSTQVYTRIATDRLNDKHKQFHPRDKMSKVKSESTEISKKKQRRNKKVMFGYTKGVRTSDLYPRKQSK